MSEMELRSVGLELSALAASSFDNLVTWYWGLQEWRAAGNERLLVDVLDQVELRDTKRIGALNHARKSTRAGFYRSFDLLSNRRAVESLESLDFKEWTTAVEKTQSNLAQVLQNLEPRQFIKPIPWMIRLKVVAPGRVLVREQRVRRFPAWSGQWQ